MVAENLTNVVVEKVVDDINSQIFWRAVLLIASILWTSLGGFVLKERDAFFKTIGTFILITGLLGDVVFLLLLYSATQQLIMP